MTTTGTDLPLVPSDEELAIRESVAGICAAYGPNYPRECFDRGEPIRDLWRDLSAAGFAGKRRPDFAAARAAVDRNGHPA